MNGWLITIAVEGVEPDTRNIREFWAVSVEDEIDALAKAVEVSGGKNPQAVLRLNAQTLAGLGIIQTGVVTCVKAIA